LGPIITLLVHFEMTVIWTKFGVLAQNDIPMAIRRTKLKFEVELKNCGCGTDTTAHRMYF